MLAGTTLVAGLAATVAAGGSFVVPLEKRGTGLSINSKADLNAFAKKVGFEVPYKFATGAKHYAANTGSELSWFSLADANSALNNITAAFKHSSKMRRHTKRAQAQQTLISQSDGYYTANVEFGSQQQVIPMNFDSGSSDTWVRSSENKDGQNLFDAASSSTGTDLNKHYSISYGDGSSVTCEVWQDQVSFQGLQADNQVIGVATGADIGLVGGIQGMAWKELSSANAEVFVQTLFQQGKIDQNLFAFNLKAPTLQIGAYDPSAYNGDLVWAPCTERSYWITDQVKFVHNGIPFVNPSKSVIDSGTTAVVLPWWLAGVFWATFPFAIPFTDDLSTIFYIFPCDSNFGTVTFEFGDLKVDLTIDDLILGKTDSLCVGSIYGQLQTPQSVSIIGDVIMDKVYFVFDYANQRIGAAAAK